MPVSGCGVAPSSAGIELVVGTGGNRSRGDMRGGLDRGGRNVLEGAD